MINRREIDKNKSTHTRDIDGFTQIGKAVLLSLNPISLEIIFKIVECINYLANASIACNLLNCIIMSQ